jgi:hypothetical protein
MIEPQRQTGIDCGRHELDLPGGTFWHVDE